MSALTEAIRRSRVPRDRVGDDSPMRVLGRRQLSGVEVFAQSVATTAPAASMVVVPTMLLSHNSAVSGLLLLAGVLTLTVLAAVCLAQFTRRMVSPGGLYSFAFQGLGPRGALLGGASILLKYLASACLTLYHGTLAVTSILHRLGVDGSIPVKIVVCLAIISAMGAALIRGVRVAAVIILVIELISLTFIVAMMVFADSGDHMSVTAAPSSVPFWLTVVFSLAGFESATFLGSEAKRPYVSVTRAVLWTPVLCGALFLVAGWAALTGRANTLVDIYLHGASADASGWLVTLLQVALSCSWLASSMASSNAASRILFTMGLDRVLPACLATVGVGFRTPRTGIVAAVAAVGVLVMAMISGGHEFLLPMVQTLTRVGLMSAYAVIAVASVLFVRRIGELTAGVYVCGVVAATGAVAGLITQLVSGLSHHSATASVCVVVLLAGSALWYRLLRKHSPQTLAEMGAFDRADSGDVLPGAGAYGPDASGALVLVAELSRSR